MTQSMKIFAFVDESGSPALDSTKDNVSNLYIGVAILVNEEEKRFAKRHWNI